MHSNYFFLHNNGVYCAKPGFTQNGFGFTIDNPEDSGSLTVGTQVMIIHHSRETDTLIKVQGTITAVDQARAEFALTQTDQEDMLLREPPISGNPEPKAGFKTSSPKPPDASPPVNRLADRVEFVQTS